MKKHPALSKSQVLVSDVGSSNVGKITVTCFPVSAKIIAEVTKTQKNQKKFFINGEEYQIIS
jgi:hypothetical protein